MPVVLSPATARSKREAHSKLDALLAKLAAKKMQMDRQARRERGEAVSDSDEDDPANDSLGATPPPPTLTLAPRPRASTAPRRTGTTATPTPTSPSARPPPRARSTTSGTSVSTDSSPSSSRTPPETNASSSSAPAPPPSAKTWPRTVSRASPPWITPEASIVAMRNAQRSRVDALRRNPPDKPPPHPFEVDYRVMDVTAMTYPERSFDCVVDKATLDTMCQLDDEPDEAAPPGPPTAHPLADTHAGRMLAGIVPSAQARGAIRVRHVRRAGDAAGSVGRAGTGVGRGGAGGDSEEQGDVLRVRVPAEDGPGTRACARVVAARGGGRDGGVDAGGGGERGGGAGAPGFFPRERDRSQEPRAY